MESKTTNFGACLVSMNLYDRKGKLKWCIRDEGANDLDCGWRFLSEIDTEEFLDNSRNWGIITFEDMVDIEPAVLVIFGMPVGTDMELIRYDDGIGFIDNNTGNPILNEITGKPLRIK